MNLYKIILFLNIFGEVSSEYLGDVPVLRRTFMAAHSPINYLVNVFNQSLSQNVILGDRGRFILTTYTKLIINL